MIKIYKLYSPSNPHLIYIGSTEKLNERKSGHVRDTHQFIQGHRNFRSSCRLAMKEDCEIIELEKCEEKDRYQREQIYMIIAKLIYKQGYINQRWAIPLSGNYHTKNYMKNCNPIIFKERKAINDKKYREGKAREQILENKRLYHHKNKEKINLNKLIKIRCECGKFSAKGSIARHKKTKYHLEYLKSFVSV
jgi:hypothetical protein|tara:strand:+ start:53 stop:628 length:576 start_codon:yes stop_codon:yes gene_type:complete